MKVYDQNRIIVKLYFCIFLYIHVFLYIYIHIPICSYIPRILQHFPTLTCLSRLVQPTQSQKLAPARACGFTDHQEIHKQALRVTLLIPLGNLGIYSPIYIYIYVYTYIYIYKYIYIYTYKFYKTVLSL